MKSCLNFRKYSKITADFENVNVKFQVIFLYYFSPANENIQKNFQYLGLFILEYFQSKNYKNHQNFNGIFLFLNLNAN
jgi:hypothetical protein